MTDHRPHPSALDSVRVSRRQFLGAAGGATAALALAACGGSGTSTTKSARATSTGTSTDTAQVTPPPFHSRPDLIPPSILVAARPENPGIGTYVFTDAHGGHGQQGPMIIDRAGNLVWFLAVSDNGSTTERVMNLRVQTYRGQPVLTYWTGGLVASHGAGHYVILDEHYRQIATVQAARGLKGDLHEFRLTPQGTALLTAYGQASARIPDPDGQGFRHADYFYCCAQEIDVATGKLLLEWRSDRHVPFSASHRLPTPEQPTTPWDPFHMNSINVDPSDGNLVVSLRNMWSFYKVNRKTGKTMWTLGGDEGEFGIGRGAHFAFQHHVTPHGNGIYTVFDNAAGPPAIAKQSRGLVLNVDEKRRRVKLVRAYRHAPPVLTEALGSVQPLGDGHMFVGWGDSSYFTEWDARGNVVLDARLSGGVVSYRAFQEKWRGTPVEPPRIVVVPGATGGTLYASWNGATVHRGWRVLGGLSADKLAQLAVVAVHGFETGIELSSVPPVLAVEAIDDQGVVVARSNSLQTRV
jgi:hypothetical protein